MGAGARADTVHERFITLLGRLQIQAVKTRIVEVVAFHSPRLVIHLLPFVSRRNPHFDIRCVQLAVTSGTTRSSGTGARCAWTSGRTAVSGLAAPRWRWRRQIA